MVLVRLPVFEPHARQQTHGLAEADAGQTRPVLNLPPLREHGRELVSIHLDPLAPDQRQTLGGGQQCPDLLLRQGLAVHGQRHVEVQ